MSELFEDQDIELVIWSKMRDFFLNKYCLTNYFDTILWLYVLCLLEIAILTFPRYFQLTGYSNFHVPDFPSHLHFSRLFSIKNSAASNEYWPYERMW